MSKLPVSSRVIPLPPPKEGSRQPPPPPDSDDDDDEPPPPDDSDDDSVDLPPPSVTDDEPEDGDDEDDPPPSDDEVDFNDDDESSQNLPPPPPEGEDNGDYDPPSDSEDDISPPQSEDDDESIEPPPSESDIGSSLPPPSEDDTPTVPPDDSFDDDTLNTSRMTTDSESDLPPPPIGSPPYLTRPADNRLPLRTLPSVPSSVPGAFLNDEGSNSLSVGLKLKQQPQQQLQQQPLQQQQKSQAAETASNIQVQTTQPRSSYSDRPSTILHEIVQRPVTFDQQAIDEAISLHGYISVMGKFQGDPYEPLHIKATKSSLLVRTDTGEEMSFDLATEKVFVYTDPSDSTCFVLEYEEDRIIIFKVHVEKDMTAVFTEMPQRVFQTEVVDDRAYSSDMVSKEPKIRKAYVYPTENDGNGRKKGQSVEDILEGKTSAGSNANSNDDMNKIFYTAEAIPSSQMIKLKQQRRKELIDSHLKKPLYSARRVRQLCKWINSLHLWPNIVDIFTLHREVCSGVLLARLMKHFLPATNFLHLNEKPLTDKAALENLDKVIGVICRSKYVNNTRVPTPKEIFKGNTSKIIILLQELFDIYVKKPLYAKAVKMLRWFTAILKQYNQKLPDEIFEEGDLSGVWGHFQSGLALFNIIYHFYGGATIGEGATMVNVDPLRVSSNPKSISEFRSNITYVFSLFRALQIETIWSPDDWLSHPDTEFIVLQLDYIHNVLKDAQCSIPPAQGKNAGVTSGPNGEPMVVGMVYADTTFSAFQRMSRGVLLGSGDDALPLMPIDIKGRPNNRYNPLICPQGIVSTNVKMTHVPINLKQSKAHAVRGNWNNAAGIVRYKEYLLEDKALTILRSLNQKSSNKRNNVSDGNYDASLSETSSQIGEHGSNLADNANAISLMDLEVKLSAQFAQKIQELEEDMYLAQKDTESLEEDLVSRYLELESSADQLDHHQYELTLGKLEFERKTLEAEKQKLQDHFSMRTQSIKSQHDESLIHAKAQLGLTGFDVAAVTNLRNNTPKKESLFSSSSGPKSPSRKIVTTAKKHPEINKGIAEKGWISVTSKMVTKNFHIKKMQSHNIAVTNTVQTPSRLKMKEKEKLKESANLRASSPLPSAGEVFTLNPSVAGNTAADVLKGLTDDAGSTAESKVMIFQQFKLKLQNRTTKWYEDKGRKVATLEEYINGGTKVNNLQLIAIPVVSNVTNFDMGASGDSTVHLSAAIRSEEMIKMAFEDDRRQRYLRGLRWKHQQQSTGVDQSGSRRSAAQSTNSGIYSSAQIVPQKSTSSVSSAKFGVPVAEVEAAFKWLSITRPLVLADRKNRVYSWTVKVQKSPSASDAATYILEWKEIDENENRDPSDSDNKAGVGFIVIGDLSDIGEYPNDPSVFSLVVGNSVKALKSSGGRPVVNVKCTSMGECTKYRQTLQSIWLSLNQNHPASSSN